MHQQQHGMTLIETMVAMTISSVLILGSIQMYAQARSSYRTAESVARMQENLRFSIDILVDDVQLAGYWGKTNSANAQLLRRDEVIVMCDGNDVTEWVMDTLNPVADTVNAISALQQESDLPDGCRATNPRNNSDVLIVRHATTNPIDEPQNDVIQIQSNGSLGIFFDSDVLPEETLLNGETFNVSFSAYYVSNESKYNSDLPSLRRLRLRGNRIEDQEIIPGVENLQIQFGVIKKGETEISMYVDGDDVGDDTIVTARLWLLVRSEQNEAGQGYVDNKGPYQIPGSAVEIGPSIDADAYPPTFRRTALSRTIVIRNLAD